MDDGEPKLRTDTGAIVNPLYARRDVMHYAVTDHELRSVSFYNTLMAIFASIGSFLLAVALSIWIGAVLESGELSDVAKILIWVISPAIAVIAVVFYGLAWFSWKTRQAEIDTIRREATQ